MPRGDASGFRRFTDGLTIGPMFWKRLRERHIGSLAKLYCQTHERWLNRALSAGASVPRIPLRRVADGGYAELSSTPTGRAHAALWWDRALSRVELRDDEAAP
jgi:hypothetical protein